MWGVDLFFFVTSKSRYLAKYPAGDLIMIADKPLYLVSRLFVLSDTGFKNGECKANVSRKVHISYNMQYALYLLNKDEDVDDEDGDDSMLLSAEDLLNEKDRPASRKARTYLHLSTRNLC